MNTAIEILERSLKSLTHTRNIWANDKEENLSEEVADFDKKIEETKAAIDHLKRKVKKDPRVDGLPEANKYLIVWLKYTEKPFIGTYNPEYAPRQEWFLADHRSETHRFATTDEILFYADPNEII
jgi:hypothetical protein